MGNIIGELMSVVQSYVNSDPSTPLNELVESAGVSSRIIVYIRKESLAGSVATCKIDGGEVLTATVDEHLKCYFDVHFVGTYTITCGGLTKQVIVNSLGEVKSVNLVTIYGFHIDNGNESDPSEKVTYLEDAVGMTPAYMNLDADTFNYGSWKDAFFMPRPCMLKYDGTVDYYLDPNDYTKKENGTSSDISSSSYEGNAMMEWGQNGQKIWLKLVPDSNNGGMSVYISNQNVDIGYNAWSFINCDGDEVDHFYTAIYDGTILSGKLRSISGNKPTTSTTFQDFITAARTNNPNSSTRWDVGTYSDRLLITMLLILMSKSLDSQGSYGYGYVNGDSSSVSGASGSANLKGLFYGSVYQNSQLPSYFVKVFGMENYWGNVCKFVLGSTATSDGTQMVKMTYGATDESSSPDYNLTGEGYITIPGTARNANGGMITKMLCSEYGLFPIELGGSSTTHYTDYSSRSSAGTGETLISTYGGYRRHGYEAGMFYLYQQINTATSEAFGAALSYR